MAVTDKLKGMVEELRRDLNEVKDQVKELLPLKKTKNELPAHQQASAHPVAALQRESNRLFDDFLLVTMPKLKDHQSRGRRISIGTADS
jgi:hypothetical protein